MEIFFAHHDALFLPISGGLLSLPKFLPRRCSLSVSSTLMRCPARGSPLRAPTGRPRSAFFCRAPALPEVGVLAR
ncbi:MAG: hypothetical protein ACK49B_05055 [Burkholderiales bacterium]